MPVSSLFRSSPIATVSQSHRPVTPIRRRAPIIGALCVLSIGTLTALAYRTWCPQPHRRVSLLRTKFVNQVSAQANFTRMSASAIVPSIVVYVTVPNHEAGKKLSESIINEKLAACVNIVPGIQSIYWWDGKVQTDSEELLIIKTRESLLNPLTEHIKANHEYEVPEVIALPINGGNDKYLEWIKNSTRDN